MELAKALDVAHQLARQVGAQTHCSEPMCADCALLALAKGLKGLRQEHDILRRDNTELRTELRLIKLRNEELERANKRRCDDCGRARIDGLCPGGCDR